MFTITILSLCFIDLVPELSQDKKLLRPAIEFILRQRLLDPSLDREFLSEVQRTFEAESSAATLADLRNAIEAIAGNNEIQDAEILKELQGLSTVQTGTITTLGVA